MILQRIRQFYYAITGRLSSEDREKITQYLPAEAVSLFDAMHPADQYHAFRVARSAAALCDIAADPSIDRDLLIRCALLHDIGRQKGDMDIWGKVFDVLMMWWRPQFARRWAAAQHGRFRHALFIYLAHPSIGAEKLIAIGMKREAEIISLHHTPPSPVDCRELCLLRYADEKN